MLKSHMDAQEDTLVTQAKISANSGHGQHKGTPREIFIREYLQSHLPENVAIGTGEIIDANSRPGEQRNQFDIVIYRRNYPKLDFGGGISGFLIESVVATIEVKSTLDQSGIEQAIRAARNAKQLMPNTKMVMSAGYVPPKVLSYVVAYDGPAKMKTVHDWIPQIHAASGTVISNLSQNEQQRLDTASPSIDAIFILKKGFLYFDNVPFSFANSEIRAANPNLKWVYNDTDTGNLLLLFLFLQAATANLEGKWLDPIPYLKSFNFPGFYIGTD